MSMSRNKGGGIIMKTKIIEYRIKDNVDPLYNDAQVNILMGWRAEIETAKQEYYSKIREILISIAYGLLILGMLLYMIFVFTSVQTMFLSYGCLSMGLAVLVIEYVTK